MFTQKRKTGGISSSRGRGRFCIAPLSLLLVFAAAMGTGGCSPAEQAAQSEREQPDTDAPLQTVSQTRRSAYTLMASAAYKTFEASPQPTADFSSEGFDASDSTGGDSVGLSSAVDSADGGLKFSYPFDSLKILSAVKFSAEFVQTPDFLEETCGEGELEYVIAEFETYVKEENGGMRPDVNDVLLAVRGAKGYYCSLNNSYMLGSAAMGLEAGARYYAFSSHKKLDGDSVDKDFTLPVHMLYTKENADGFAVAYGREEGIGDVDANVVFTPMSCPSAEQISTERLYTIEDLSDFPQAEVTGTVSGAEPAQDGSMYVYLSGTTPSCVFLDSSVGWTDENGEKIPPTELAAGDTVTATFDRLFEGYAPDSVRANRISVCKS